MHFDGDLVFGPTAICAGGNPIPRRAKDNDQGQQAENGFHALRIGDFGVFVKCATNNGRPTGRSALLSMCWQTALTDGFWRRSQNFGGGHRPPLQHFAGLHGGETRGADERGFVVHDDPHRHRREEVFHSARADEGFHELPVGEFGNDFGGDAAANVNAAGGENFQGEVRRFGAVIFNEQFQRLDAEIGFVVERGAGDDFGGLFAAQFGGEPPGLRAAFGVAQEFVDMELAGTGEDGFPIHLAETFAQVDQEFDVQIRPRGEIRVAAFGGDGQMTIAIPEKARFAETGAGGDDGGIADGAFLALVKGDKILGPEAVDAVGVGFKVVDEPNVLEAERLLQVLVDDDPGKIGHGDAAVFDGARDAEAGVIGFQFPVRQKFLRDFFKGGEVAAGIRSEIVRRETKTFTEKCEVNFCAANVSCKNHELRMARVFFPGKGIRRLRAAAGAWLVLPRRPVSDWPSWCSALRGVDLRHKLD